MISKTGKKKLGRFDDVIFKKADITSLKAKNCLFDGTSCERFFEEMGYDDVAFELVRGRMSCDIAVINVNKKKD